jgi:hypothetical protein
VGAEVADPGHRLPFLNLQASWVVGIADSFAEADNVRLGASELGTAVDPWQKTNSASTPDAEEGHDGN